MTFQKIGEHRSELDPQFDPTGAGRTADWNAVVQVCETALKERTKDLQIAAWLAEAWARRDGFAGLHDGLTLVRLLSETFWQELHPGVDDGAIEAGVRARPLTWLGGSRELIRSIKTCPIVHDDGQTPLSWEHYELSQIVDQQSLGTDHTRYDEMIANGWIGGEEWRRRLRATPPPALRDVQARVGACEAALEELRKLASQRFEPADMPNLVPLGNLLGEIREHLESYVTPAVTPSSGETRPSSGSKPVAHVTAGPSPSGPIQTREQALRMLAEIAEFYRRTEPHSPIAALVARAARWGEMPFEEVLREMVRDEDVLARVWDQLGIRREPESSGD